MYKRFVICLALSILSFPNTGLAQFTGAHHFDNTPVGTSQLELSYAYANANASIDTSLIVSGAKFHLDQGTVNYTRYFGLMRHLIFVEGSVPLAHLSGSIAETNVRGAISGAGDSTYSIAALLKGGPALSARQFQGYRPTTAMAISLTVNAPTGQYNPNILLNLGSGRWSFKPELAISHPFGPENKWQCDVYAHAYFFSDNTSYRGKEILRQDPLPGLEGHISYSVLDRLWVSTDFLYAFRGTTFVNGVDQNDAQETVFLGTEASLSLNPQHSVALQFSKAIVHQNGPALVGFTVKYNFTWGHGGR